MRVRCPGCRSNFEVPANLIPDSGILMNCSQCGNSFVALAQGLTVLSTPTGAPGDANSGLSSVLSTAQQEPVSLTLGETLHQGRFEIKEFLGRGGFGTVYRVLDKELAVELALKVVATQEGQARNAVGQLADNFTLREKIKDRTHVLNAYLPLLDEYKGLSLLLLPMELADGGSLRAWMTQNPDVEKRRSQALEFFRQSCHGVAAIHTAGLVHLDLKPENMLIVRGDVKISDFGLSRDLNNLGLMDPSHLRDGVGTACYMAPEQILAARPKDVNHLADIYALGCVLFELLDGDPPYSGTPHQILEKHERRIAPKLADVDEQLVAMILRCLDKDPCKRFGGIGELLEFLEHKQHSHLPSPNKLQGKPKQERSSKNGLRDSYQSCYICDKPLATDEPRFCRDCKRYVCQEHSNTTTHAGHHLMICCENCSLLLQVKSDIDNLSFGTITEMILNLIGNRGDSKIALKILDHILWHRDDEEYDGKSLTATYDSFERLYNSYLSKHLSKGNTAKYAARIISSYFFDIQELEPAVALFRNEHPDKDSLNFLCEQYVKRMVYDFNHNEAEGRNLFSVLLKNLGCIIVTAGEHRTPPWRSSIGPSNVTIWDFT